MDQYEIEPETSLDSNTTATEDELYEEQFLSTLSLVFALLMIFMCLAGALMNTVSLWIFTRKSFRKRSFNILLCGLSVSDFCLCVLAMPVFTLSQLESFLKGFIPLNVTSRILLYMYPLTLMAQTSSIWILVAITIDRWLAVCHPFLVRIYCTQTRAALTLVIIFTFSIAYNFCRFWEYTLNGNEIAGLLRDNSLYMILYQNISMLLSQFVLPLLVLCILNLQVARTILEAGETRRELVASEKREHSTAKMMLFVVIVFIFCYSFSFCLNPELFKQQIGLLLNDINNILVVINSSSSFIFYIKYSSRYRSQLQKMPIIRLLATRFCLIPPSSQFSAKSEYTNISNYSTKHTFISTNNSSVQKHSDKLRIITSTS
ncbi:FMRFamide receptor [Aphelenchoides bicaudatus]|nr:FMRFamide receptor [Aphelenchoides bicaudatus]